MNGKTDFVGPARAQYMVGLQNAMEAAGINDAIVRANLKSIYGDRIDLPSSEKVIIGGDLKIESPTPTFAPIPSKSNLGCWIAVAICATVLAMLLILALAGGVWLLLSQRDLSPVVPPPPSAPSVPLDLDLNADFFTP